MSSHEVPSWRARGAAFGLRIAVATPALLASCTGDRATEPPPAVRQPGAARAQSPAGERSTVPPELFGAHTPWNDLGNHVVARGEQIRDRSFRMGKVFWRPLTRGAATTAFQDTGGAAGPPLADHYPGHATLTVGGDKAIAALYQVVQGGVEPGEYSLEVSSRGATGAPALMAVLVDSGYEDLAPSVVEASDAGAWKRHTMTLQVHTAAKEAHLGLCVISPGSADVDEVRFSRTGGPPVVKDSIKARIAALGVRSLRWPGGSDLDTLDWRETVGPLRERGEQSVIYGGLQTPSYGLHEFLDLCAELRLAPVIAVNVLDTPASAADLLEYVRGDVGTTQGKRRAAHGRPQPWSDATRFEIGNEPTAKYALEGRLAAGGRRYAARAKAVAEAMHARAARLQCRITTSGVVEGAMQLADWLGDRGESVVTLLHAWNQQCLDEGLPALVQAVHAHYYSYHGHAADVRRQFENLMAAGTVLRRTLHEKIRPLSGALPIWLTEYNALVSDGDVVLPSFTKDFQSGLVVADILMTLVDEGVPVAHIHNLSEFGAFGMLLGDGDRWHIRPAGLAFSLLSAAAGEERLPLAITGAAANEQIEIRGGVGNIPRGTSYARVAGFATRNGASGRPRVFLLNRDYDDEAVVALEVEGQALGSGDAHWYRSDDVAAHNEQPGHDAVKLAATAVGGGSPWTITLPAHSLVRIDFR
jgi:alpha-N-arabinofuranosidase